jgi:hypothetical protein
MLNDFDQWCLSNRWPNDISVFSSLIVYFSLICNMHVSDCGSYLWHSYPSILQFLVHLWNLLLKLFSGSMNIYGYIKIVLILFSIRDEGVHWGIQNGLYLSRSTIVYFKHNDMESLRNALEKITVENKRAKELRRYIVVEAVYQVSCSALHAYQIHIFVKQNLKKNL